MQFISEVYEKLQRHPKRVVFSEGEEERILLAARQYHSLRLGAPIVLGNRTRIKELARDINLNLKGIRIICPSDSEDLDPFTQRFIQLKNEKGVDEHDARELIKQPNYYGAMMLATHQVDGLISGSNEADGGVLRPLSEIINVRRLQASASSCMFMEVGEAKYGESGALVLADCAIIQEPSVYQLAETALHSAKMSKHIMGQRPKVAFLSYATHNNQQDPGIGRIADAVTLARQKAKAEQLDAEFDGPLQADAALIPKIAATKLSKSKVAGHANVLIFPDLNSANIASKLLQYVAHGNAYGHILMNLNRPAAQISQGISSHEIVGVAALVGLQSVKYKELYPAAPESAN